MLLTLSIFTAFLLDKILGETKRFHPLVGFGQLANHLEHYCNCGSFKKLRGALSLAFVITPFVTLALWLEILLSPWGWASLLLNTGVLYLCIGWQSLLSHAQQVALPLTNNNLEQARQAVAMIVSRDCTELDETGIANAATESVLENGGDAIFSSLFWFVLLGPAGAVTHRLVNTLDAMWGYRNERFEQFGWAAARLDDVMNFIPARLTALSYALAGQTQTAIQCWLKQGLNWKSPNAGPVMAAGAGALNISLGGEANYGGISQQRPALGPTVDEGGIIASADSIQAACSLVNKAIVIWLFTLIILSVLYAWL